VSPSDDHLSLDETADLLRISRTRTRQLIREGKLEASKEGRCFRVTRASVYARIGKQTTPPGVQRTLYFARHFRDLTSVDPAKAGRWGHRAALAQVSAQMFGTKQAEPYRDLIWLASMRVLEAGAVKDWRALDDARADLHDVLTEYEFVAAPLSPEARLYEAREAVAVPLFGETT
jgi:excisionase family DNA binding protein